MSESSLFLSSCTRRQLARRRSGRVRSALISRLVPMLLTVSVVLAGAAAFMAGRGGL